MPPARFLVRNQELMQESFRTYGERLAAGRTTPAQFAEAMRAEIKAGVVSAYRFAKAAPLDAADLKALNAMLAEQDAYLDGFLAKIAAGGPLDYAANRAQLYAGAATEAAARGHLSRPGARVRWVLGPVKTEHCETCIGKAGEHDRATLLASGILPGSGTACGGACRCFLQVLGQGD